MLCVGLAYLLAVIHVRIRDTADVLAVALRLLFFVTPVIYDESRLEGSRFVLLWTLNPMAHVVTAYRDVLLFGRQPDVIALTVVAAVAVVVIASGWLVFARAAPKLVDEI
jgi:lipopolysaccharide transport system permease protein